MFSLRPLLIAPLAACALAGPAVAATTPSYDVDIATKLAGNASGTDNDGWTSKSKFSTNIGQTYRGLSGVLNSYGDETVYAEASVPPQIAMTTLDQQYALVTVAGTISWSCAPDGQADGAPGSIQLTHTGNEGSLYMFVLDKKVTQARDCSGFSSFADTIDISKEPVTVPPTTFSWADLVKNGTVTVPVDRMVNCGEWTIYQTACSLRLTGNVTIRRSMVDADAPDPDPEPEPTDTATPEPTPTGYQPAESGDDVSSPPRPATPIRVRGSNWHNGKGAKVKVRCDECTGRVTVKAGSKSIGTKRFSNADKPIIVIYGKGGRAAAHKSGSVIINVNASGQSSSYRMKSR